MKAFKQVDQTRRDYHSNPDRNSTHRSSLLVPELPNSRAEVSFLNHFLLKRGITSVGCRVTAIDGEGCRIESRLFHVTDPRVYTLPLSGEFGDGAQTYLVEFFSAENLFIPFCAAMANHHGEGFSNVVHSFNRILNDPFEDDEINGGASQVEAAIDIGIDSGRDAFLVYMTGARPIDGLLQVEHVISGRPVRSTEFRVTLPKLSRRLIPVAEMLPDLKNPGGGTLKVRQPHQFLFFGRMMAGRLATGGDFTANHSYYDSSGVEEYWDDARPATRLYPFFPNLGNRARFYPIMSPGRLVVSVAAFDAGGRELLRQDVGEIESPNGTPLDISVEAIVQKAGVNPSDLSAYAISARPVAGNTPTRVNHQLICGAERGGLAASINMSLGHPAIFRPAAKPAFVWGEVSCGADLQSWIGFCGMAPDGPASEIALEFYGHKGLLSRQTVNMAPGAAKIMEITPSLIPTLASGKRQSIWYIARSARSDLNAFAFSQHRGTGHCSGEHNF